MHTHRKVLVVLCQVFALLFLAGLAAAQTVTVSPGTPSVTRGETFTVDINIGAVTNLQASHAQIAFDNTLLEYVGRSEGAFFPAGSFSKENIASSGSTSTLAVDQAIISGSPLAGSGTLFTLTFRGLAAVAGTPLGLSVSLRDPLNGTIAAATTGGTVTVNNPLPALGSTSPTGATAGTTGLVLTATGTNFVPGSTLRFKGVDRTTTYVNATTLTATIPDADLLSAGSFPVVVVTPAPGGGTSGSVTFNVTPAAVDHFVIAPVANQTAGTPFSVTMTAQDAYNNTVTGFSGSVTLSASAGGITPATSGAFSSGVRTESVTLTLAGSARTIGATDGASHSGTSNAFDVAPGALHHFAIATVANQTAGTPFAVSMTAQDANNNTVSAFNGTVTLSASTGGITPTTSGAFAAGLRTESVTITLAGAARTISVTDGASHSGTSNAFDISGGTLDHFAIAAVAAQTAGAPFAITITAQDAQNNTVAGFTGTVTLSTSAGIITPTTSGSFVSGVRTESVTLPLAGTGRTIGVTDGGGHTGLSNSFTVNAGAVHHFVIGPVAAQTVGTAFAIDITAQDAQNNTADGFNGTVNLATTAGTVTPAISESFAAGTLTQTVSVSAPGTSRTISVSDGAAHAGTSNAFDVGSAPGLFLSSSPALPPAGTIYPCTAWGPTAFGANDWAMSAPATVSCYLVLDAGTVLNEADISIGWDTTHLRYQGTAFGSAGSPNGLFGSGQTYGVSAFVTRIPDTDSVLVHGGRTDGNNITTAAGGYVARVDFTLRHPGYSAVTIRRANVQRVSPTGPAAVVPHDGSVKAYLGDVASVGNVQTAGDGVIGVDDLILWSASYWSGVPGYGSGMTYYREKYDIGPTTDGFVFTMPVPDRMINFEDLIVFSISYGRSASGLLPKTSPPAADTVDIYLGAPVLAGGETRVPILSGRSAAGLRGLSLELSGSFGAFLGADKGSILREQTNPVMLLGRAKGDRVYVDLAVMGSNCESAGARGELASLRFAGTSVMTIASLQARGANNQALTVRSAANAVQPVPTSYALAQNYPNPFNPTTTISYALPQADNVVLEVYNVLGEKVATLVNEPRAAGSYAVRWDGRDARQTPVGSGIYFCRIQSGSFTSVIRMLLVK